MEMILSAATNRGNVIANHVADVLQKKGYAIESWDWTRSLTGTYSQLKIGLWGCSDGDELVRAIRDLRFKDSKYITDVHPITVDDHVVTGVAIMYRDNY